MPTNFTKFHTVVGDIVTIQFTGDDLLILFSFYSTVWHWVLGYGVGC